MLDDNKIRVFFIERDNVRDYKYTTLANKSVSKVIPLDTNPFSKTVHLQPHTLPLSIKKTPYI